MKKILIALGCFFVAALLIFSKPPVPILKQVPTAAAISPTVQKVPEKKKKCGCCKNPEQRKQRSEAMRKKMESAWAEQENRKVRKETPASTNP